VQLLWWVSSVTSSFTIFLNPAEEFLPSRSLCHFLSMAVFGLEEFFIVVKTCA
jgi:hypothetical protein